MAEADMADGRRIDQRRDGLLQLGERGAKPRMEQQGLVVANEEMVEGEIEPRREDADAEDVGGDLVNSSHVSSPRSNATQTQPVTNLETRALVGAAWQSVTAAPIGDRRAALDHEPPILYGRRHLEITAERVGELHLPRRSALRLKNRG